jgi:hypothetical protein
VHPEPSAYCDGRAFLQKGLMLAQVFVWSAKACAP